MFTVGRRHELRRYWTRGPRPRTIVGRRMRIRGRLEVIIGAAVAVFAGLSIGGLGCSGDTQTFPSTFQVGLPDGALAADARAWISADAEPAADVIASVDAASASDAGSVLDGAAPVEDAGGAARTRCDAIARECAVRCDRPTDGFPDVDCLGPLAGAFDDVTVDNFCDVSNALVVGEIRVRNDGILVLRSDVWVCQDVEALGSGQVTVSSPDGSAVICGDLEAIGADRLVVQGGLTVLGQLRASSLDEAAIDGTTVCERATFFDNQSVFVAGTQPSTVVGDCSAAGNQVAVFSRLQVLGDNRGCQ